MGSVFDKIFHFPICCGSFRVLILGLKNSGKTTILQHLRGQVAQTTPTIGMNVETVRFHKITITVCDLGYSNRINWKHQQKHNRAVIYVVDLSDRDRLKESRDEFNKILEQEQLKHCVLLILTNKQDIGVMNAIDIVEYFNLEVIKDRPLYVQSTCGLTGDGLHEAFIWLDKALSNKA